MEISTDSSRRQTNRRAAFNSWKVTALFGALAFLWNAPSGVQSQTCRPRAGPEFRINTYVPDVQTSPVIASLRRPTSILEDSESDSPTDESSAPGYVVVWTSSGQDGSGLGIYGQLYQTPANVSSPVPLGDEFAVNTVTTFDQRRPSVASLATGGFVVVWQSTILVGTLIPPQRAERILAQIYDPLGAVTSTEFLVSSNSDEFISRQDVSPSVTGLSHTSLGSGGFAVGWISYYADNPSKRQVMSRTFSFDGTPRNNERVVQTFNDPNMQNDLSVGSLSEGKHVVSWSARVDIKSLVLADASPSFPLTVRGQLFLASSNPLGAEFTINNDTKKAADKFRPNLAGYDGEPGGYVAVWQSRSPQVTRAAAGAGANTETTSDGNDVSGSSDVPSSSLVSLDDSRPSTGIFGQRFDSEGARVGGEFIVNTFISDAVGDARVTTRRDGGFVVVWNSRDQDGDGFGVYVQQFGLKGAPEGPETLVNVQTTGSQSIPSVAVVSEDTYVTVWASESQDPDGSTGVYGRVLTFCPNARDCVLSDWSAWSQCTQTCGEGGVQNRTRSVVVEGRSPGQTCDSLGPLTESRACNTQPCPSQSSDGVDCTLCFQDRCYVPLDGLFSQTQIRSGCGGVSGCDNAQSSCIVQVNDPGEQAYLVSQILPKYGSVAVWTQDTDSLFSSDDICLVLASSGAIIVPTDGCQGQYRGLCEVRRPLGCPTLPDAAKTATMTGKLQAETTVDALVSKKKKSHSHLSKLKKKHPKK